MGGVMAEWMPAFQRALSRKAPSSQDTNIMIYTRAMAPLLNDQRVEKQMDRFVSTMQNNDNKGLFR